MASLMSLVTMLFSLLALLTTSTSAQNTAKLGFYYNWLAQFDCDGLALTSETITEGQCVDIATISYLGKHWQAMSGQNVPTGCSGLCYHFLDCFSCPCIGKGGRWNRQPVWLADIPCSQGLC